MDDSHQQAVAVLKALGHAERLRLYEALLSGEACVCHLEALIARPQPYVSQQLAVLRAANLVADRREGQHVYYRLTSPTMAAVMLALAAVTGRDGLPVDVRLPDCPCPRCASPAQSCPN